MAKEWSTLEEALQSIADTRALGSRADWLTAYMVVDVYDHFFGEGTIRKVAGVLGVTARQVYDLMATARAFPTEEDHYQDERFGWHETVAKVALRTQTPLDKLANLCAGMTGTKMAWIRGRAEEEGLDMLTAFAKYGGLTAHSAGVCPTCKQTLPKTWRVEADHAEATNRGGAGRATPAG